MKKVAIVDNYDSFTYNLVHYLEELGAEVTVMLNDQIIDDVLDQADGILLSPGPGLPQQAGDLMRVLEKYTPSKPMLGVCLGMQALGAYFGAELVNLKTVFHGVASTINVLHPSPLFDGLAKTIEVGRYHSWVVKNCPDMWCISSKDSAGNNMSFQHNDLPLYGVQFHPESILTPDGKQILNNWLSLL